MLFHLRQIVFILFLAVQINLHIDVCCQFLLIRVIVAHVLFRPAICFISSSVSSKSKISRFALMCSGLVDPGMTMFQPVYAILR